RGIRRRIRRLKQRLAPSRKESPPRDDNAMSEFSLIGKPVALIDSAGKTTGAGKYTDDLSLPGMLIGKILHCPYPHAIIKRSDATRALALDGVVGVVTGQDAPNKYGILPVGHDETALAGDKVRNV